MSLIILVATAVSIGIFAQKAKARSGAMWGVVTFGLLCLVWVILSSTVISLPPAERRIMENPLAWTIFTLLVSVTIGLGMAVIIASLSAIAPSSIGPAGGPGRRCPFCAERIQIQATICRFCQRDVPQVEIPSTPDAWPARCPVCHSSQIAATEEPRIWRCAKAGCATTFRVGAPASP